MLEPSGSPTSFLSAAILTAYVLRRALNRVAHMEQRARSQRAHVVGRDIGIALNDPDGFRRYIKGFADYLRQSGIRALAHIDRAAVKRDRAVGRNIDDRNRRGGRHHRLDRDAESATPPDDAAAAVERLRPCQSVQNSVRTLSSGASVEGLTGGMDCSFAQKVLSTKFGRIEFERARHHVHVAFVGPDELGTPKPRSDPDGVTLV